MFGLMDSDLKYIFKGLDQFPEIRSVTLFGSRALGNYKKGSDVDLAILGESVTHKTIIGLNEYLNEIYPLPYFFDLIHYASISNENLKKHIDQYGKILYDQQKSRNLKS